MLHLTNPCAKRKVLSLTKQKGKISKIKPLGHYITNELVLLKFSNQSSIHFLSRTLSFCPVQSAGGCRIHWLHPDRRVSSHCENEYLGYDIKHSDGGAPVLQLWGMWITAWLPLLPSPFWTGVVVPERIPFMGQIELSEIYLCPNNYWC